MSEENKNLGGQEMVSKSPSEPGGRVYGKRSPFGASRKNIGDEDKGKVRSFLNSSIVVPFVEEAVESHEEKNKIREVEVDQLGRSRATGRRKRASCRVWIKQGEGYKVNGKSIEDYFADPAIRSHALSPLKRVGMEKMQVFSTVKGGGLLGQAGALRHGIARALDKFDPSLHTILKAGGFLTRDSRKKERKTPGFRTARKPQQFSKR